MSCERYKSKRVETMFGATEQVDPAHSIQLKDDKEFLDYIHAQERLAEKKRRYSIRAKKR